MPTIKHPSYPIEEESPCIHHRSAFDTIPAPPPSFGGQPDGAYVTRIHAPVSEPEFAAPAYIRKPSEPTMLSFRGGEVELPKPTRADLVLSAQQWATAIREHLVDWNAHTASAKGMCDRLDAILRELTNADR